MMKSATLFLAALAVAHAAPSPQGVTALIAPDGATPETCAVSHPGTFGLSISRASGGFFSVCGGGLLMVDRRWNGGESEETGYADRRWADSGGCGYS